MHIIQINQHSKPMHQYDKIISNKNDKFTLAKYQYDLL